VILGTAGDFVILAKSGISTVPASAITGDIGVSPITGASMTGFSEIKDSSGKMATSGQVTGTMFAADYNAPTPVKMTAAVSDMETAYTDAAGRPNEVAARINLGAGIVGGVFGGMTAPLTPGVYTWGSDVDVYLASSIYVSGGPDDIFILQTTGDVVVASDVRVVLDGGAVAENIFWQVAGAVRVGARAHLEGVFLVKTYCAFVTGSSLNGRILAQTAVTLQAATINE
ncbi:hypothetical protein M885DRAFT_419440, partial [Pelagophyceae sp. CCMP2097]